MTILVTETLSGNHSKYIFVHHRVILLHICLVMVSKKADKISVYFYINGTGIYIFHVTMEQLLKNEKTCSIPSLSFDLSIFDEFFKIYL
jgi:hypothetical protein